MTIRSAVRRLHGVTVVLTVLGCQTQQPAQRPVQQGGSAFDPAAWQPPGDAEIPDDSLGASIRRGLALVLHTADSLPRYAPGDISCGNCHLQGGRNPFAVPLTGSHARFPKYLERTGAVIGLADRVNYCFTRSLAGNRLPTDSREMQDILAYLAWLSRGIPVGEGSRLAGAEGLPSIPQLTGDGTRGKHIYAAKCAACHQVDGRGARNIAPGIPALWGPKSFSVGASMARQSKAASFIWNNMPLGMGKSLTHQEAHDVAKYIVAQPRPNSPGKENDWPRGGAPADVPYSTTGHTAFQPPPVLPRASASQAIVDAPKSVRGKGP